MYDEENNRFDYISSQPTSSWYHGTYFKHTIFNNTFIFISGTKLYSSNDLKTFTAISSNTKGNINDAIVCKDTLYALSSEYSNSKYTSRIYSTKDLSAFDLVYEFNSKSIPLSLEYYDNNFYVGTGSYTSYTGDQNGSFYRINLGDTKKSLNLNKDNSTIEIIDSGKSSVVEYDLSSEKTVFETTLTFDNNMNQKEWIQEYSKIRNLGITFAAVTNGENVNLNSSTSYFNTVLSKNITTSSVTAKTGVEYGKKIFLEELNIEDDLFTLSSTKISESENEYKTLVTLTITNGISKDDTANNNTDDNSNTNTNTNTNTNNNINSTITPPLATPEILPQEVLIIPPSKTRYNVGEKLSLDGLKITAIYENNKIEEVTKGYKVTGYNKNKVGKQTVKISYKNFSSTYEVKVGNSSNNVDISETEKLPQTGNFFDLLDALYLLVAIFSITLTYIVYKSIKCNKTQK